MHTLNLRSFLWFTTGVVLTITSVATFGAWRADAAVTPGESTFVPIAPCRLFDTRPGEAIPGSVTSPFGAAETRVQQVTGSVGNCTIPTGVSGVAMNVTVHSGTGGDSYLALFPADQTTIPLVSNLNWAPGQGATPNKVDVKLSPDGKVKIYNNVGTVGVIGDVVGYYQSSTVAQLSADLAALQAQVGALDQDVDALLTDTNVIPSGTTVTGYAAFDTPAVTENDNNFVDFQVHLPGRAGVSLTPADVNFAPPDPARPEVTDGDPSCTGNFGAPTAPAGKVCLYLKDSGRLSDLAGSAAFTESDRSFFLSGIIDATSAVDGVGTAFALVSWAYTAP